MTNIQGRMKVLELIQDIEVALMVTHDETGRMRGRPMSAVRADADGDLWFLTSISSPKIAEIAHDPQVLIIYSEPTDMNFVSIQGVAEIAQDRKLIEEMWVEYARIWFPKGKSDPDVALIRVKPEYAEYWDAPSGAFVMAYGYLKSQLTGEPPNLGDMGVVKY